MGFIVKAVKSVVKAVVGVVSKVVGGVFGFLVGGKKSTAVAKAVNTLNKSLDPEAFKKIVFGRIAAPLDVRYWEVYGPNAARFDEVIALAGHRINAALELYMESEVGIDAAGNSQGKYAGGTLTRDVRLGAPNQTAMAVGGGGQWTAASTFDGVPHMLLRWLPDEKKLPNGIPSRYTQVVEGALVYDPRRDSTVPGGAGAHRVNDRTTWEYATLDGNGVPIGRNNALQTLWYLLGWTVPTKDANGNVTGEALVCGRGVDPEDINLSTFIAGANNCEIAGYYTDMVLSTEDTHTANEDKITCAGLIGRLIDPGGLWSYYANVNDTANIAVELTDADIIQGQSVSWNEYEGMADQFNQVTGKYINPSPLTLFQAFPYPMVRDANYEAALGVKRRKLQDFEQVLDGTLAQRLARLFLNQGQYQGEFGAAFNYRAVKAQAWSVVRYTSERFGFVKLFRVWRHDIDTFQGVSMLLKEIDPSIWSAGTVNPPLAPGLGTAYQANQEIPLVGLAVANVTISGQGTNTNVYDGGNVTWTEPSIAVRRTEVRYRVVGTTYWETAAAVERGTATNALIYPLVKGTHYQVQARHVSIHEVEGPWNNYADFLSGSAGNVDYQGILTSGVTAQWPYVGDPIGTRPEDNATVGAPSGTPVAGVPAETLVGNVNTHTALLSSQGLQITNIITNVGDLQATYGNTASSAASAAAAAASLSATLTAKTAAETARNDSQAARDAAQGARDLALGYRDTAAAQASASATSASQSAASNTAAGNSATASQTARLAAETARDASQGYAGAASGSASSASASATLAGQKADAASASAVAADTSRGGAVAAQQAAAISETNAAGSASSAASSASVSATARNDAGAALADTYPQVISGDAFTPYYSPMVGASAMPQSSMLDARTLKIEGGINYGYGVWCRGITTRVPGRKYELIATAAYIAGPGNNYLFGYVAGFNVIGELVADNLSGLIAKSILNDYSTFKGNFDTDSFPASVVAFRFGVLVNRDISGQPKEGLVYLKALYPRDITEQNAAAGSASASAASASSAAASQTAAGQSASAAESAKVAAQTAKGGAESARDQAALSESNSAGSASSSSSFASQSATARDASQSARDTALGYRNDAQTAASASSSSASLASASQTAAAQSATAANQSKLDAATSAGAAGLSQQAAATSASNAAGLASAASSSATLSATAANASQSALASSFPKTASIYTIHDEFYLFLPPALPLSTKVGDFAVDIDTNDINISYREAVGLSKPIPYIVGQKFRLVGKMSHEAGLTTAYAYGWVSWFNASGSLISSDGMDFVNTPYSLGTGVAKTVTAVYTMNNAPAGTAYVKFAFLMNRDVSVEPIANSRTRIYALYPEDITESTNAAGSASASAASASSAAASKTATEQSASAANQSKLDAQTAAGSASASQTASATSASNAAGSASAALSSANLSATARDAAREVMAASFPRVASIYGVSDIYYVMNTDPLPVSAKIGSTGVLIATDNPDLGYKYSINVAKPIGYTPGRKIRVSAVLSHEAGGYDAYAFLWVVFFKADGTYISGYSDSVPYYYSGGAGVPVAINAIYNMTGAPAETAYVKVGYLINRVSNSDAMPGNARTAVYSLYPDDITEALNGIASLTASVSSNSGAITDLKGRALAYWQQTVNAGAAGAFVEVRAETSYGAGPSSNVSIGAREIHLYNQAATGAYSRALSVAGGRVTVFGDLDVGGAMRFGTRRIPVALQSFTVTASDGQAISFGGDLTNIPKIEPQVAGLPALASGKRYDVKTLSLTSTGFTTRAKIVTQGTPSSQNTGAGVNAGNVNPKYRAHKPSAGDAVDGNYNFFVSGQVKLYVYGGYGGNTANIYVDCYVKRNGAWQAIGTLYTSVSTFGYGGSGMQTFSWDASAGVYFADAIGQDSGGDYEFGIDVSTDAGNINSVNFSGVTYQAQGTQTAEDPIPQAVTFRIVPQNG